MIRQIAGHREGSPVDTHVCLPRSGEGTPVLRHLEHASMQGKEGSNASKAGTSVGEWDESIV